MSRKFTDDVELPNRDPSAGNYAARKTYVDNKVADATQVTTNQFDNNRMPRVLSPVRALTPSVGALSIDASVVGNNIDVTVGAAFTQNVPTNGVAGQVLNVTCYASGAYVVTFNASFVRLGSIASTLSIPSGKFARYQLRCTNASGTLTWIVEAAAVSQ